LNLDLRPYQPGDEHAIIDLFGKAFRRPLPDGFWGWRFGNNPNGQPITELAWDGPVLAGHYTVSPIQMRVNGVDYMAALSGTTMTHPNYQGLKLFPILSERVYGRMAEAGMLMVMGFPNNFSHRIIVRDIGWTDIHEVPVFYKDFDDGRAVPPPSAEIQSIDRFDDRFDALWERTKDCTPVVVNRSSTYLNWRYVTNPTFRYTCLALAQNQELLGYAVCKPYQERSVDLVDLSALDDTAALELVYAVAAWARKQGAQGLNMWLNYTMPLHRALEGLGFRNAEPITYFGGRLTLPGGSPDVFTFRNWHLMMGDSDVY
jgi:hypothetical protein